MFTLIDVLGIARGLGPVQWNVVAIVAHLVQARGGGGIALGGRNQPRWGGLTPGNLQMLKLGLIYCFVDCLDLRK